MHAGIYFEPGSLKTRLCRRGVALLRAYCAVLATAEEIVDRLALR